MTESQKRYYAAAKKLGQKKPSKAIPRPRLECAKWVFRLVTHKYFDIVVTGLIILNALFMSAEHFRPSQLFERFFDIVNYVFVVAFTAECLLKMIGLRFYYFTQPWNIFDFVVVVLSILSLAFENAFKNFFSQPSILRVIRLGELRGCVRGLGFCAFCFFFPFHSFFP